jgi:hypothetical protein
LHTHGLKPSVANMQAGKEINLVKLTVKAKRYALNTACGCTRTSQGICGINHRVG